MRVLQQVFYYAKGSAEPSRRTSKVPQNSGEGLGAWARLLRTVFFSPKKGIFLERESFETGNFLDIFDLEEIVESPQIVEELGSSTRFWRISRFSEI